MSDIKLLEKIKGYNKDWCYQYQKRIDTLKEDMEALNWTEEDLKSISLNDFEFLILILLRIKRKLQSLLNVMSG